MNDRQRRWDEATARAVARGVNILPVRGPAIARRYMEFKRVPADVIARTLSQPALRRPLSPEQSVSEAITPSPQQDEDEDEDGR